MQVPEKVNVDLFGVRGVVFIVIAMKVRVVFKDWHAPIDDNIIIMIHSIDWFDPFSEEESGIVSTPSLIKIRD